MSFYNEKLRQAHEELMQRLSQMTAEEVFQTAVDAGIYDKDGNLLPPYCEERPVVKKKKKKSKK